MKSALIISPQKDEARLIGESLPSDYQVQNANSIEDALDLHRQSSFDVIFSDLNLLQDTSEADTIADAVQLFREMNPLAEILILSSKDFIRETVKAVKSGANDYLKKRDTRCRFSHNRCMAGMTKKCFLTFYGNIKIHPQSSVISSLDIKRDK